MVLKPVFNPEHFYYLKQEIIKSDILLKHVDFDNSYDLIKGSKPSKPVRFNYVRGSREKDIIFGGGHVCLLSKNLIGELKEHGFTGWDTFNVSATGKNGVPLEGYVGLFINGKAGPVDHTYCKEILKPNPMGIMESVYVGPGFDPKTWDGSDIFSLEGTVQIIVSNEVKEIFEKFKTNNITFTNVKDYTRL